MRAYHVAALAFTLTGCREIVRELLKEDHPSESAETVETVAPPPTATPSPPPPPPPWPDDPPPKATSTAAALATATVKKVAAAPAVAPTCANVCEKSLKCLNAYDAKEQNDCVTSCEGGQPDPVRFSHLLQMDCKTLVANLKGPNGAGGGTNKQASPCGADKCGTCVWDGSSCYSRVPPFLACDACCCRPGGPAPRWD